MASRVHEIHHFSFDHDTRPRRYARYRDDPVVLPLSRSWGMNGAVLALALIAAGVAAAGAYSVFRSKPPAAMAQTPLLPLERDLGSDAELTHAHVIQALNGPALAVRDIAAPESESVSESVGEPASTPTTSPSRDDYVIHDSAPGVQPQPSQPAPIEAPYPERTNPPYPNPSTTPPEGIAPPETAPETPTPALNPDNPYR